MKKYLIHQAIVCCIFLFGCQGDKVDRGIACLELGDYETAQEFFSSVIREQPRNFKARLGMGKALLQQAVASGFDSTKWERGLVNLEAAQTIEDSPYIKELLSEAWLFFSREMLAKKDSLKALSALNFALENNPEYKEALSLSGIIFAAYGYGEKADSLFASALQSDSSDTDILFNLGMMAWHQKKPLLAKRYWEKVVVHSPHDEKANWWLSRIGSEYSGKVGHE